MGHTVYIKKYYKKKPFFRQNTGPSQKIHNYHNSILPEQMKSRDLKFINVAGLSLERKLGVVTHAKRSLSNAAIELFN